MDEAGWRELGAICDAAMERFFDVLATCAKGKAADPARQSILFTAGLTFFEMPKYEPARAIED